MCHGLQYAAQALILPILVLGTFSTSVIAVPTEKELALSEMAVKSIRAWHYNPSDIDDDLSKKSFENFIESLDPSKRFLTQQDLKALKKYETKIDEQILSERVDFFEMAVALYQKRLSLIKFQIEPMLSNAFDFTESDSIQIDAKKKVYAKSESALLKRWKKELKYYTLNNAITILESQASTKNSSTSDIQKLELTPEVEKEARDKTRVSIMRQLKRLSEKNRDDFFYAYINAIVQTQDPTQIIFLLLKRKILILA